MDFFLESQKRKEKVREWEMGVVVLLQGIVVLQELADVKQQLEIIKQDIADLKVSCSLSLSLFLSLPLPPLSHSLTISLLTIGHCYCTVSR